MEDERAPDAERAAEQPSLEHHVVARRRQAGLGRIRRRPVVLGEHERSEIDLLGELDKPVEGGSPRIERGRPGLDVGDVAEPACNRLEQFGLLARGPEENARLVHARFMMTDIAHTLRRGQRAGILHVSGAGCRSGGGRSTRGCVMKDKHLVILNWRNSQSSSPGWTRTNNPSVNSRMLCQLSYRGLTTTRLRTLAARSAYVVFRSQLLHGLINSGPYAISFPAQPARQRAVPGDRTARSKITTSADGDAALSEQRNEPFNGNRC